MKRYLILFFSGMFLLFQVGLLQAQSPQQPRMLPTTQADVTPPEHFEAARQFKGYIHEGSASTLLIQEMAGTSYLLIKKGMTPEYFAQEGFTYISEEEITTTSGLSGVLYRMEFTVQETLFERLMLFAGDYHQTFWLVANYPSMVKDQMFPVMKESLLSLKP